jgi:hypothetical protein
MIEPITAAFERQDYKTALMLIQQLQQQSPDHPWLPFFEGRLQEAAGHLEKAAAIYRQVLIASTHTKIVAQARQGLQRLVTIAQTQREQAIAQAKTNPLNQGLGFLILEAIPSSQKQAVAEQMARIFNLDAYTARLLLPSRGWRLYRTSTLGELKVYGQELKDAGVPVFWVGLTALQTIQVFRVQYLQAATNQITVVCQNELDQVGTLTFDQSEVSSRVAGLLPIFEAVVDVGIRQKTQRKEQTQDYAQILDLHLPQRHCLLRFCDRTYQFKQGIVFDAGQNGSRATAQVTTRLRWTVLNQFLGDRLARKPLWSDFTLFAETALDQLVFVRNLPAQIDIFRQAPTPWDLAFHLYSGLVFEQSRLKP